MKSQCLLQRPENSSPKRNVLNGTSRISASFLSVFISCGLMDLQKTVSTVKAVACGAAAMWSRASFFRQEEWFVLWGRCFFDLALWWEQSSVSYSLMSNSLQTPWTISTRLLCPWDSPGKKTLVGHHSLLQRIFLTQGTNPGLWRCRQILYRLSYREDLGGNRGST